MTITYLSQQFGTSATNEMRILPDGAFRSVDGRPQAIPSWNIDASVAPGIIAASLAGGADILIDYEHQSIHAAKNGQPAPAAGWFKQLEWRDGQGMFAVNIRWNEKAKAMIAAGEYRYISPVFTFDQFTGVVQRVLSVAITNNPAVPWLSDLSTVAINSAGAHTPAAATVDPANQRGMELLARMNADAAALLNRNGASVPPRVEIDLSSIAKADPRNQNGLELIARMNAEAEAILHRRR